MKPKPRIKLSIPEPCGEDWNAMLPTGCCRHCNVCEQTVIDFTAMGDDEIIKIFQKSSPCGRFFEDQLNRELIPSPVYKSSFSARVVQRIAASLLLVHAFVFDSVGQQKKQAHTTTSVSSAKKQSASKHMYLRGQAIDVEMQKPIAFLTVTVTDSTGQVIATDTTNATGNYALKIPGKYAGSEVTVTTEATSAEKLALTTTKLADLLLLYRYTTEVLPELQLTAEKIARQPRVLGGVPIRMHYAEPIAVCKPTFWQKITYPFRKKKQH